MFNFPESSTTPASSTPSTPRFPFPEDFEYGVEGKLVGYEFKDNAGIFTFQAKNGGEAKRYLFDPSQPNKDNVVDKARMDREEKSVHSLVRALNIRKSVKGSVATWKEFLDTYFADGDFADTNFIRLKAGYDKGIATYDPSKFEGKSVEQIKKARSPFVKISNGLGWFTWIGSDYKFTLTDYDKLFDTYELVEEHATPSVLPPPTPLNTGEAEDVLPF